MSHTPTSSAPRLRAASRRLVLSLSLALASSAPQLVAAAGPAASSPRRASACRKGFDSAAASSVVTTAIPAEVRLATYRAERASDRAPRIRAAKQVFEGIGPLTVYNPTQEFRDEDGRRLVAARVEALDSEDSFVLFFQAIPGQQDHWKPAWDLPVFPATQDPFLSRTERGWVFGGVGIVHEPGKPIRYRTVFYQGESLRRLKPVGEVPWGMKDVRVAWDARRARWWVFTRPQRRFDPKRPELDAGPGMVGLTWVRELGELTPERINAATLFEQLFAPGEWGGINQARMLPDGRIRVHGHVARAEEPGFIRHYYSFQATVDPETLEVSGMRIDLERADLGPGLAKRPDLVDVVFNGGYSDPEDVGGASVQWVGAGDAETYRITRE